MHFSLRYSFPILALLIFLTACREPVIELEPEDHIVLIGNALADRMQHDGWTETLLQAAYPDHQLVIRNQGFTGDRINHRPRSQGFPPADEYLALSGADVIFAFFGYNESFDNDPDGFADDVAAWIDSTSAKNYSGDGPPRLVLFSPIAHEDLKDPNLPDGSENNARLEAYTDALKQVATEKGAAFVDLFSTSKRKFSRSSEPLTINGVHLNHEGNRQVAEVIVREISGSVPRLSDENAETIRSAVQDKNWYWFNRYRATDGNDVWGSRSVLAFVDDQTNFEVLQNELIQLDYMTANRDQVIWAAVNGEDLVADDSDVPPPVDVITNLEEEQLQDGVSKLGSNTYISAEEGLSHMTLPDGLEANVFASEEMFPELINPVQVGIDTRGRLWAATWPTYPKWAPTGEMGDRLLILPDENRDGVADTAITFAYVHNPTGFEFWNGGVIVASVPDLLFLKDTDGDDVADVRIPILGALGSADTHHSANNFFFGPDGFIYYQRGVFNISNVETPWSTNQESPVSGMYRFNPRTYEFSYHALNVPNAHGTAFDYWGFHYATDATGGEAYQVKPNDDGTFSMQKLLTKTVRPVTASGILSSEHLPPEYEGDFVLLNVIAFLGAKQYNLAIDSETGDVWGTESQNLISSSDPNFRPSDFEIGDDGAIYLADWENAVIGHMQHNVRDPSRDHEHGRIYRISATGRPLSEHVAIDGQPIAALLTALEHPVNGIRQRARVELSERDTDDVLSAVEEWLQGFDEQNTAHAHHFLEGLWLHQRHNRENMELLQVVLSSPEPLARIAGERIRLMWEHRDLHLAGVPLPIMDGWYPAANQNPDDVPDDDAIVIRTVPEEMRYDKPSFTVTAGQSVKLWFANDDALPHNLIITQPETGDAVGDAADAMGADGFEVGFIPETDAILQSTDLLNREEHQTLEFTAPMQPGTYDVLCTFPGHRTTMHGVMVVIAADQ